MTVMHDCVFVTGGSVLVQNARRNSLESNTASLVAVETVGELFVIVERGEREV